ncbi:prepilin-type N-terminal cleavage/methylation domain-containing protein [Bacillus timonensis]|nr:prepilin-type N-terminal cleavage/methylation domain-containing protein [Bacillus timonensis]
MNEKGFTLIEMLVVMVVISILLLVAIPNVTTHNQVINDKGCEAFKLMVEAQVQAYNIENNIIPSMQDLIDGGYVKGATCPNGKILEVTPNGDVQEVALP